MTHIPKCFLWPDHAIGKRESRSIREEHNATVNAHADLLAERDLFLVQRNEARDERDRLREELGERDSALCRWRESGDRWERERDSLRATQAKLVEALREALSSLDAAREMNPGDEQDEFLSAIDCVEARFAKQARAALALVEKGEE